jgi:hypothetical protein
VDLVEAIFSIRQAGHVDCMLKLFEKLLEQRVQITMNSLSIHGTNECVLSSKRRAYSSQGPPNQDNDAACQLAEAFPLAAQASS